MPILRLRKHQATFSEEDILINQNDYPGLKLRDVVEIKLSKENNRENVGNRILLQVRKWPDTNNYPNCVSIKESVANAHLKLYSDVLVTIVDKKDVLVDSIEICFSNAYLARSYMWGLRNHLNNRCVYQRQKLDYLNIRSQICEIWAQGNKVTSGYVDDDTKLVFRSASSLVYLFIQMSSEMWDYDINGDLYCEKAINGFLTDLFDTWKRNDCSHDITIVLFSRTYYDAESLEEFPKEMRECLQVDYKNRYYEDCYRVAFQNDRFDLHDWNVKLTTLKSLFNQYQKEVIDRHQEKYDVKIPRAYNSSAAQGNFLEVLNMSLNVFEKHYFDRSFDRTGQLSVVVSPGVGVFEVDFEMTNLTKQRIIDNGIGSDLVCLGEQPLHTVPLLKFNSKSSSQQNDNSTTCDVYNMPHWINLSFYSSQNQVYYSNFIPRIKLPTIHTNKLTTGASGETMMTRSFSSTNDENHPDNMKDDSDTTEEPRETKQNPFNGSMHNNSFSRQSGSSHFSSQAMPNLMDYDDYDAQVFKPNPQATYNDQKSMSFRTGNGGADSRSKLADSLLANSNVSDYNDDVDFLDRDDRGKTTKLPDAKNSRKQAQNNHQSQPQMSENLPIKSNQQNTSPTTTASSRSSAHHNQLNTFARMSLVDSFLSDIKIKPESADDLSVRGYNVQSSRLNRTSPRPKALINPFDPSHMTIKLTPNRRRWTHVFPQGPTGTFMQQHHYQPLPEQQKSSASPYLANVSPPPIIHEHEPLSLRANQQPSKTNFPLSQGNAANGLGQLTNKQSNFSKNTNLTTQSIIKSSSSSSGASFLSGVGHKSTLVSNDTVRFAWCASGEQEWTPAITTGVDWKSLTMPACLPLTTDFFPSKTSLQNDYVIGEYNIDSSCIHPRYTLIDVYHELVCQRLQKGFQIILLPRSQTNSSSSSRMHHSSHHHGDQGSSSMSGTSQRSSKGHAKVPSSHHGHHHGRSLTSSSSSSLSSENENLYDKDKAEYTMSIGRIFHKLALNGNTITVTQYKPRHPYPTIKIDYCYRFRAPFHETYGQSWVHFKSEKLENYNWNYLDNYICARGESFELRNDLKFWRFRILILSSKSSLRKTSETEENSSRHDLHFLDYNDEERASLMESFVRLLEIINKTRRASACRMSSSSISSINSSSSLNLAPLATSTLPANNQTTAGASSTGSKQSTASVQNPPPAPSNISPTRLNVQINSNNRDIEGLQSSNKHDESINGLAGGRGGGADGETEAGKKNDDSVKCLRPLKFESINMDIDSALRDVKRAEWVHVQYHCFYDVNQAFELVIKWMVASGAGIAEMVQGWSRKVGSSSVHVVPIPWEPFALPHSGKADPLRCPIGIELNISAIATPLNDNQVLLLQEKILRRFGFIRFHDLISSENIERQFVHMSGFAFVALPNIVNDDDENDYHHNSSSEVSSPSIIFNDGQPKLFNLQPKNSSNGKQVASSTKQQKPVSSNLPLLKLEHQDTVSSPHEEYITRHISGARKNKANRLRGEYDLIEFIWSWNYMLTKRWRSASTQDESYAVSLMQDFKAFCRNSDNRLVEFWREEIQATI